MKKAPKIRIKGFEGEWKECLFGSIMDCFSGGTPQANEQTYYGGEIPFIRSGEINDNNTSLFLSEKGLIYSSAKMIEKGTLLYALYGATSGEVSISRIKGAINQAVLAIYPYKEYDKYFIKCWLEKNKAYIISTYLQGGQGNLSGNIVKSFILKIPQEIHEQRAIATYFRNIDSLIETSDKKLASLKQVKEASLQSMFPKEGQKVPEVRFKGFEGEWKVSPFADTFMFLRNNSLSRAELNYKDGLVKDIHYGDVLIKFSEIINANKEILPFITDQEISKSLIKNGTSTLEDGDIVFSDAAEDETVGKCSELFNVTSLKIVSGLHTIPCRPIIKFANCYLGFYLNSKAYHNQLLPLIQGTKISSLSKAAFHNTNITFPKDIQEQRKIASFFVHLDKQIAIAQQRLDLLRRIKSACLDEMFA